MPFSRRLYAYILMGVVFISFSTCKKDTIVYPENFTANNPKPVCFDCDVINSHYEDTIDHPTILGGDIKNPYLLSNMKAAYLGVYHKDPGNAIWVTHLYMRFSPRNYLELSRLEEEDIALFDYPLHRELIFEGDYYVQQGKSMEDVPDYYAVVDKGYKIPPGIKATVMDEMYIPDNDPLLENEALRITGNLRNENEFIQKNGGSDDLKNLYPDPGESGSDNNFNLLPGKSCGNYPSGKIVVQNELLTDRSYRPVTKLKVVIRRLFKVDKMYTDINGVFTSKKYFRNKYTIHVHFKNDHAAISRMRPWALHEQFFPVKINFGKWDNLDCGHEFRINHPEESGKISTSHWCAAITHNGIQEYLQMCKMENIAFPPENVQIMLSQKQGSGNGNTYMMNKIMASDPAAIGVEILITDVILFWSPVGAGLSLLAMEAFKARSPDVKYGYGGDPAYLTTDRYCELVYHELSHASHYSVVGNKWWIDFGMAESKNNGPGFYGQCCTKYADRIALAEGWSYFLGHYMADKKWGLQSTLFPEHGNLKTNENLLYYVTENNISSHIYFLESYNPFRTIDQNYWIPKGLFYDLYDPAIEVFNGNHIVDEVSGIKCSQMFGAMAKDVYGIDEYKKRLIARCGPEEKVTVQDLFRQYGY